PPTYMGRSWMVVVVARRVMSPTYMPDPETPHIARPIISAFIFGAAPQMADPTSNTNTERIYVHLALNWPNILPQTKFVPAAPIRNATLTHGSFSTDLKCAT